MIRFTWLQSRVQVAVAFAALAALAIALAITGHHLDHLFSSSGLNAACLAAPAGSRNSCQVAPFLDRTTAYFDFADVLNIAVPAVAGLLGGFWGAPLIAGELSTGTHRLAWTQGVTRGRWLLTKLGVAGGAAIAAAGVLSLMVTLWAHPIDEVNANRFTPSVFLARGLVPLGYAAFAFALAVTTGALLRRAVPAIALTLAIFAALQFAFAAWVRPHLATPVRTSYALTTRSLSTVGATSTGRLDVAAAPAEIQGAWILSPNQRCFDATSCQITTPSGRSAATLAAESCNSLIPPPGRTPSPPNTGSRPPAHAVMPVTTDGTGTIPETTNPPADGCEAYVAGLHLRQVVDYQPASRFWTFQAVETAIYLALALVISGFCLWWVRSRLT